MVEVAQITATKNHLAIVVVLATAPKMSYLVVMIVTALWLLKIQIP